MSRKHLLCVVVFVSLFFAGCATTPTGETYVKPEAIQAIDNVADVVDPLSQTVTSLGFVWPPAAVIGGLLAGMVGVWRKMKPELETAKGEAKLGEIAGQATAVALEEFKKQHPEEWETLSSYLQDNHGPTVENFYRALRGLPPKD